MTIKLDDDHDLEIHGSGDQYWARIVDRKSGQRIGDRLLASGTNVELVIAELKQDARVMLGRPAVP